MEDYLGVRQDERGTLEGFLDWYRAVIERKVDDLTSDEAKRLKTPTGMSLLGILKHLGWVERGWFCDIFAGEDVEAIDVATIRLSSPSALSSPADSCLKLFIADVDG